MKTFIDYSTDFLFWMLDGVPIMNTPWILVYIVIPIAGWVFLFYLFVITQRARYSMLAIVTFLPMLFIAMGPPLWQTQMLSECHNVVVTVDTELVNDAKYVVRECRFKDNYYSEFGDWEIVTTK